MIEWLFEAGIGESRAAMVRDGAIIAARVELDDGAVRVGAVLPARLVEITVKSREGRVAFDGGEAMLAPLPPGITQGSALTVEIVREALPEPGRIKLPRCIAIDRAPTPAPTLLDRITATGHPVRTLLAHQPDALEQAGWSEVIEEALTGDIAFPLGALRMTPTPAMTLFDVDGYPPLDTLALAAASAVGAAILRHDVTGSIGIDFPTIPGKAARTAVDAALDSALAEAGPFERTAMNGFGFTQVVRRRMRAALPDLLRADPAAAQARALLRTIERSPPPIPTNHTVSPRIATMLAAHPDWITELARRTGVTPVFEVR